eukprot:TRINITY_DN4090_c0_g1_i1.p1 TRINITY_DN4090_c0_g1~~TRINITY_DN4090_c0_g1_i1.p1  ORF type:complete len:581 (+),score=107.60 TRINITY_DN4090_c0_g1_i1:33-1775(+)
MRNAIWIFTICFALLATALSVSAKRPSSTESTKTDVLLWPWPQQITHGDHALSIDSKTFSIAFSIAQSTQAAEDFMRRAISRYTTLLFPASLPRLPYRTNIFENRMHINQSFIPTVEPCTKITIKIASADLTLQQGIDESYSMSIQSPLSSASSQTVYGALHILETLSQLIKFQTINKQSGYYILQAPLSLSDFPRFGWRGLLVDSARHYLSPSTIYRIIDGLAYNKMNVLHWHLFDAESIPFVSKIYTNLTTFSAYSLNATYTYEQITKFIIYAQDRGVRIVPEFDTPGHTASIGQTFPDMIADCWDYYFPSDKVVRWPNWDSIALDPTNERTKTFVADIWKELISLFPEQYVHLGGDEVKTECWDFVPKIKNYAQDHGKTMVDLWQDWTTWLQQHIATQKRTSILWQEPFGNHKFSLRTDTIIHVWNNPCTLAEAIKAGYKTLYSWGWYLDRQVPTCLSGKFTCLNATCPSNYMWMWTWHTFYENDLGKFLAKPSDESQVLGGEASSWGESTDSLTFDDRVFSRLPAIGERLWSASSVNDVWEAQPRLSFFRCHVARRGVRMSSSEPQWCQTSDVFDD